MPLTRAPMQLPGLNGGRLTTETGVPVSTSDRTSQGTLYWTPYRHGEIALPVTSTGPWRKYQPGEISLALTLTSGKNYDVFGYLSAGTLALELSAAWTNDTTRADALGTLNNVTVKNGDKSRFWLGTIRASGANVTQDSAGGSTTQVGGKRFVWNAFNQVHRQLAVKDTADNWVYTTDTIRIANGASAPSNCVEYVTGDSAVTVQATFFSTVALSAQGSLRAKNSVGVDSGTVFSGWSQAGYNADAGYVISALGGYYVGQPGLGYHYLAMLEKGADGADCQFTGDDGGDHQTGMYAWLEM
jgi:hypothetical protein